MGTSAKDTDAERRAKLRAVVDKRLEELDMRPSKFGAALGRKNGYQGYFDLFGAKTGAKPEKKRLTVITPELLERIEDVLELHRGFLADLAAIDEHAAKTRAALLEFLKTDVGKAIDANVVKTLESIRFAPGRTPSKDLFFILAAAVAGLYENEEQLGHAILDNVRAAKEPPPEPAPRSGKVLRKPKR